MNQMHMGSFQRHSFKEKKKVKSFAGVFYLSMKPWRVARPTPLTPITSVPFRETYIPTKLGAPSSLIFNNR